MCILFENKRYWFKIEKNKKSKLTDLDIVYKDDNNNSSMKKEASLKNDDSNYLHNLLKEKYDNLGPIS